MATWDLSSLSFFWQRKEQPPVDDSSYAREYVRRVYEKVGVTPELKRVYGTYVENERKREQGGDGKPQKAKPPPPVLVFKRLGAACARGAFSCGDDGIDSWFRNHALNHHNGLMSRVTTVHLVNNAAPVGVYAMSIKQEKEELLDRDRKMNARPHGGYFVSVRLSSVAVLRPMHRQGIGTVLMGRALDDFYEIATRTGVFALTLEAIDQETTKFYEKLGFVAPYGPADAMMPKMLLPADAIIAARQG